MINKIFDYAQPESCTHGPTYRAGLAVELIFTVCLHEQISPTGRVAPFFRKWHLMASARRLPSKFLINANGQLNVRLEPNLQNKKKFK